MKTCDVCKKGSMMGGRRIKLRGNFNPTASMRKYPNLQKTRLTNGKRALACATCIKKAK